MKKLFLLALVITPLLLSSCGDDNNPDANPKTLNKALLYDKIWSNQAGQVQHYFGSDNDYALGEGTWSWVNDTDTMLIEQNVGPDLKLVFNGGNTADRCEIKLGASGTFTEFRTSW